MEEGARVESGVGMPAGSRMFEFEIQRVLGQGGFKIVYLALDHSLHRLVAVAEYYPGSLVYRRSDRTVAVHSVEQLPTFEAGLRSFIAEARLLAQFDHPSLVKVYRFWEANGTGYMVMPFYQGPTLQKVLKTSGMRMSEATLRPLIAPLLDAVGSLHREKYYHRDISPDNIIVQANGVPVLLDLGAARRIIGDMTQTLTVMLKPGYAPLEQYGEDGGPAQGPWTDVYAFAAVLYFAVTGKQPPAAVTRLYKDTLVQLREETAPGYGARFLQGIHVGLTVRPEDRPQSIAEFQEALGLSPHWDAQVPTTGKALGTISGIGSATTPGVVHGIPTTAAPNTLSGSDPAAPSNPIPITSSGIVVPTSPGMPSATGPSTASPAATTDAVHSAARLVRRVVHRRSIRGAPSAPASGEAVPGPMASDLAAIPTTSPLGTERPRTAAPDSLPHVASRAASDSIGEASATRAAESEHLDSVDDSDDESLTVILPDAEWRARTQPAATPSEGTTPGAVGSGSVAPRTAPPVSERPGSATPGTNPAGASGYLPPAQNHGAMWETDILESAAPIHQSQLKRDRIEATTDGQVSPRRITGVGVIIAGIAMLVVAAVAFFAFDTAKPAADSAAEKAATEKAAAAERAGAEKAATEKAAAEKATAEKATAEKATARGQPPNRQRRRKQQRRKQQRRKQQRRKQQRRKQQRRKQQRRKQQRRKQQRRKQQRRKQRRTKRGDRREGSSGESSGGQSSGREGGRREGGRAESRSREGGHGESSAENAAAERVAAEKAAAQKAAERAAAENAAAQKAATEKAAAQRAAAENAAAQKAATEKAAAQRAAAEKAAAQKAAEKTAAERVAAEKAAAQKAAEKATAERAAAEKAAAQKAAEKTAAERVAAEKAAAQKAAEKAAAERAAMEKAAAERAAMEKAAAEKAAAEKAAAAKAAAEKTAAERAAAEKAAAGKAATERAAAEKAAAEKGEAEKAAADAAQEAERRKRVFVPPTF